MWAITDSTALFNPAWKCHLLPNFQPGNQDVLFCSYFFDYYNLLPALYIVSLVDTTIHLQVKF